MNAEVHVDHAHCVVLVVDDETIILLGTAALLESLGYQVVRASSGSAALEALHERQDIGALLTDYQMPRMSGVELAGAVRLIHPEMPVIIATGDTTMQSRADVSWRTLAKPFTREELGNALRQALAAP